MPRFPRPSGAAIAATVAAILFVGFFAVIVISVISSVNDADTPSGFGGFNSDADGPSLVRADRFGPALEKVKDRAGVEGSVIALRLDPDRVSAVVRRADGSGRVILVARDLSVMEVRGGSGSRGLSLNRIDPDVPERLVRAAAERLGVKPETLSYLAVSGGATTGGQWSVFFERGRYVIADLDGRNISVPGE
jgi:hypothetical protein